MFSFALLAIVVPFVVSAQQVHKVQVGSAAGDLTFTPEAIFADVGDIVSFEFHQKNHSVTQTSFADPCGPLAGGFNSGFNPVAPDQTSDFPVWNITVPDKNPIWMTCEQTKPVIHCHKGMVFAVNCGASGTPKSFDNFKASAVALGAADGNPADGSSAAPAAAPYGSSPSYGGSASSPDAASPAVSTVTAIAPAPSPAGNVIKVVVGGNGTLTFSPPSIKAQVGDTVMFQFQSKNHTATQSTFANPCADLFNATTGLAGFNSGFMPVAAGSTDFPTFSVVINNTAPTWVHCKQTVPISHCGTGMVMSINADESSSHSTAAFVALAKQLNGTSSAGAAAAATAAPATPSTHSGAFRSASFSVLGSLTFIAGLVMAMA